MKDTVVTLTFEPLLTGVGLTKGGSVWVHEKGVGGQETPVDEEESTLGVLRVTEETLLLSVKKGTDTKRRHQETQETPSSDKGEPQVPDTDDTPVDIG